jgi:hypothetical protein
VLPELGEEKIGGEEEDPAVPEAALADEPGFSRNSATRYPGPRGSPGRMYPYPVCGLVGRTPKVIRWSRARGAAARISSTTGPSRRWSEGKIAAMAPPGESRIPSIAQVMAGRVFLPAGSRRRRSSPRAHPISSSWLITRYRWMAFVTTVTPSSPESCLARS